MRRLEAQAKAEADAERQHRADADAERRRTGKRRQGKAPKPVDETPADKAQTNFTDPELHIMQTANKGWEYCGNAQVSVDGGCQIILACDVTEATNDKQQAEPMAQATRANLAQAGIERPRDESGAGQPSRRRWIRAISVRRRCRRWRPRGSIRTSRQSVNGTMLRGLKPLRCPPRQKSGWQRKCGPRRGKHCTPDARRSWSPCLVRSRKRVGFVDSCCAVCRKSVANGVWCA